MEKKGNITATIESPEELTLTDVEPEDITFIIKTK